MVLPFVAGALFILCYILAYHHPGLVRREPIRHHLGGIGLLLFGTLLAESAVYFVRRAVSRRTNYGIGSDGLYVRHFLGRTLHFPWQRIESITRFVSPRRSSDEFRVSLYDGRYRLFPSLGDYFLKVLRERCDLPLSETTRRTGGRALRAAAVSILAVCIVISLFTLGVRPSIRAFGFVLACALVAALYALAVALSGRERREARIVSALGGFAILIGAIVASMVFFRSWDRSIVAALDRMRWAQPLSAPQTTVHLGDVSFAVPHGWKPGTSGEQSTNFCALSKATDTDESTVILIFATTNPPAPTTKTDLSVILILANAKYLLSKTWRGSWDNLDPANLGGITWQRMSYPSILSPRAKSTAFWAAGTRTLAVLAIENGDPEDDEIRRILESVTVPGAPSPEDAAAE
ncbi:MAG: hypothetical protein ACYTAN_14885 [Planctomycetota bacterium]